jgi:class 3 adenylate cyclase/ketosteroid isomerase-like protein/tetratricopeptide (TPR) repeat protein
VGVLALRVCGGVAVEADGRLLPSVLLAGRQGRLVLAYLVCERHRAVPREELADLLWPDRLPDSWTTSLSAVISRLRRLLSEVGLDGATALASTLGAYQLVLPSDTQVDWETALADIDHAERALSEGDHTAAITAAAAAEAIADRGFLPDDCAWVEAQREVVRDISVRGALVRAEAHLLAGSASRAVEAARDAIVRDALREAGYRVLMRGLAAMGERAEALRAWERCRIMLVEELGTEPSPETESVYLDILSGDSPAPAAAVAPTTTTALPSGVVTFLLTDIVESSALWERQPAAMANALERHDALVAEVVSASGGTLLKSKLEGDATVSVFTRATAGVLAALALIDAFAKEEWPAGAAPSVRMAVHTGEAFERAGDYFGPALNRAARLRALAGAGQVLLSQAVAELVRDHLPDGFALVDRGHRDLRGLSRGENVFELLPADAASDTPSGATSDHSPIERPPVPAALAGSGPFVGRQEESTALIAAWEHAVGGRPHAVLLGGEPGVGKSRLAAECARAAYANGALVLYGRCDEELGAPFQPFIEAVRSAAPVLGSARLRTVPGVDELGRIVPQVAALLPDAPPVARADPDSERYALFDAVTQLLVAASLEAPVLLVLDDLHWAGKTTLTLLRHVLRNAGEARLLVLCTYRDTELSRSHPLAATIADLRGDRTATRTTVGGLSSEDVVAYVAAVGHEDRALGRELARVTSGNPFFLIEALRHVEESGGVWEPGSLPEGVREATGRRLSRLSEDANEALLVAAVAGTTFSLELVEAVRGTELVDEIGEACTAGLVTEEPGLPGVFRFAHALVRQVLLAELVTVKRLRMHRTIADLLEADTASDPDAHLTDLAYHWFECALSGGADKAVAACRRAAEQALERLAYEEAGDLFGMAIQAMDATEGDDEDARAALHLARCSALLTAGDVGPARAALDSLARVARGSDRLTAWHTTYAGQLAVLAEPDRLTEIVDAVGDAAAALRAAGDLVGEATAHYVHALALERLGQIGAAERALDAALAAARTAGDRRLADAILAEAPPAALWGPSPVTRASGNCLDVVRVLRITSGAASVESVALRCQGVLEALRGRMDAARRMIGSARRTVDLLGLAHRRLETDVAAGLVEILDADWAAAEAFLRPAYEELRDRGLDGEAAQAAALLGRSLLMQRRDEEAEEAGREAEKLAGSDLRAAIAWRGVLAEAAARRGDTALALELARAAVDLATATDALLMVANARLSLAAVLRATGDSSAADAELLRAVEACDAKGATVLAARARAAADARAEPAPSAPPLTSGARRVRENRATERQRQTCAAVSRGDLDAIASRLSDQFVYTRHGVMSLTFAEHLELIGDYIAAGVQATVTPLASLGEHIALTVATGVLGSAEPSARRGTTEMQDVALADVDDDGRDTRVTAFKVDELGDAIVMLYEWHAERLTGAAAVRAAGSASALAALLHASPDEFPTRVDDVLALTDDCAVLRLAPPAGDEHLAVIAFAPDGSIRHQRTFGADDVTAAFEHFDAMTGEHEPFANAAVMNVRRRNEAWDRHDWEGVAATFARSCATSDRRMMLELSPAEALESLQFIFERYAQGSMEPVATRGDRLALFERSWLNADPELVSGGLVLEEIDVDGVAVRNALFDPREIDAAIAELDRWYIEGEGAPHAGILEQLLAHFAALNRGDWAAAQAPFADECVVWDRRPVVAMPKRGISEVAAQWSVEVTVGSHLAIRVDHIPRLSATAGMCIVMMLGDVSSDGGAVEQRRVAVFVHDGTRIWRLEVFDEDRLDEALARYEELAAVERFENAAIRGNRLFMAAVEAGDWETALLRRSAAWRVEDRRPLVGGLAYDFGTSIELTRTVFGSAARLGWLPLATRGESLALMHQEWVNDDGATASWLNLTRMNADGDSELVVVCASDDTKTAYRELDRLFAEQVGGGASQLWASLSASHDPTQLRHVLAIDERRALTVTADGESLVINVIQADDDGMPIATERFAVTDLDGARQRYDELAADQSEHRFDNAATRVSDRYAAAQNRRDWSAVLACHSASFRIDDRRRLFRTATDPAESMASTRIIFDSGGVVTRRTLATRGDRLVLSSWCWEAAEAEVVLLIIERVDAGEQQEDLAVWFDADDLDAAYAALDELYIESGAAASSPTWARLANAAVRNMEAFGRAWEAHDWDAVMACYRPDVELDDRRSVVQLRSDARANEESLRIAFDSGSSYSYELLATRGQLLALFGSTVAKLGRFEIDRLALVEVDEQGLRRASVFFDPDDLDAAYVELDARYDALGADSAVLRGRLHEAAINTRDWQALGDLLAEDSVVDDHRPARLGTLRGRDGFVDLYKATIELSPDSRVRAHHRVRVGLVQLTVVSLVGTRDGAAFENRAVVVAQFDEDGLTRHRDYYDETQLEDAFARLDALVAAAQPPALDRFANAAVRNWERWKRAWHGADWDGVVACLTPDSVIDDRRPLYRYVIRGDEVLTWLRKGFDNRAAIFDELVATRGDRLSLHHVTITTPEGYAGTAEYDRLHLEEVDEDGCRACTVYFDADDLDAAFEELDARHARLTPGHVPFGHRLVDCCTRRDWAGISDLFSEGVVLEDHRHLRLGSLVGRDAVVEVFRSIFELSDDVRLRIHQTLDSADHAGLGLISSQGVIDGGPFENLAVSVVEYDRAGRATRLEYFDMEQLDEALARYDELVVATQQDPFANLATQNLDQFGMAWAAHDWDSVVATFAPDVEAIDRRRFAADDAYGAEAVERFRALFELTKSTWRREVIATRGNRLALVASTFEFRDGASGSAEAEMLAVMEVDNAGLRTASVAFGGEDLDAAGAELDDRYAAMLDEPDRAAWLATAASRAPYDTGDLEAVIERYSSDAVIVDHRLMGFGELDRDGWLDYMRALKASAPDSCSRIDHVLELSAMGCLHVHRIVGSVDGGTFERPALRVVAFTPDGHVARADFYDIDRLDDARARYAELIRP